MVAVQEKTKPLEVVDLTPRIGTEVKTDVARLLSGRHAAELRSLLDRRGVLVFREIASSLRTVYPEPTYAQALGWNKIPPAVHPLVWTHKSGRKSLVLGMSASHIEGMSVEDGKLILTKLREWATQRRYVYRHEWKVGDLVMWDNTGTMHRVMPFPEDSGRLLRRTILKGEEPVS